MSTAMGGESTKYIIIIIFARKSRVGGKKANQIHTQYYSVQLSRDIAQSNCMIQILMRISVRVKVAVRNLYYNIIHDVCL